MDLEQLIACPACDVLHRNQDVAKHTVARCARCGTVLAAPKSGAMTRIAMLSLTALILLAAAAGLSVSGAAAPRVCRIRRRFWTQYWPFHSGPMAPLSLATGLLIVLLPAARYGALVYTLAPMALGWRPAPHAFTAVYRWAERLKPWAMAEIFIIGVAVALVKVSGLARVGLGPAFWAFAALLVVTILTDSSQFAG